MSHPVSKNEPFLIYELVDNAIVPAALLVCAKVFGMVLLNTLLKVEWSLQSVTNAFVSIKPVYTSYSDAVMINSYTNLFMFFCVLAGAMFVTSKSLLFHHRKASPHFILKLAKYDLLHLLKTSLHIYQQAFVWGAFLIITTAYVCISMIAEMTYLWIAAVSVLFCLTFIWVMVENIEEDILFHNYRSQV